MSKFLMNIQQKFSNATKYINISIFLLTFLIGIIYIYNFDYNRKVIVNPTPYNIDKIEYKDEAENCYSYKIKDVACPSNKNKIKNLPV
jgi:hypothetical protein